MDGKAKEDAVFTALGELYYNFHCFERFYLPRDNI